MSAGPQLGLSETKAPAVGRLVPYEFALPNVPTSPLTVQFLKPVPFSM